MTILLVLGIILVVAWLAGLGTGRTYGGAVHVVLVIAVILLVIWMLRALFGVI